MTDDPFKPLSAKTPKKVYSISGRELSNPKQARAAEDKRLAAAIKRKLKEKKK